MQANSKHSGQLQNLHGDGATPGNGTSQNFYQLCLPTHTASPSFSRQTAAGNYFTCTVQPATSEQILASGVQATNGTKLAQENQLNSNHTLPTGKQDSQIILWNMPSNCQVLLPVNNTNLQVSPNSNGPNMSHCASNSTNSLYMHQQTTSSGVGPNNLQQFKTIDVQSLNESRINANTSNFHIRQHHANAPTNLPRDPSKTRKSLPSDLNYCPPTENAHHGPSSLFAGYLYQFAEKSNNANVQMLSNCAQNLQMNNSAHKAVAVVTPLSPIGTAPANVLDKSANVKMNVSPVQQTVHHQPNVLHPLVTNTNLSNQTGQPNDLSSKPLRPQSAEPRLKDGLCSIVGAKSLVLANESTDQSLRASSQNLKCVVAEQNKSPSVQMQTEPAEKTNMNRSITDKKTVDPDTVPFLEWPLDRLKTLISVIEQMENGDHKNTQRTDPGKEILKLYWNGDSSKFTEAAESGIYLSIMEEVYICSPMNEPVILKQIVNEARSKVIKDFHVLKHNEVPPKMTYTSSWLNLNKNVDDIDKECGYSWFYKSFQNVPEPEAQNLTCEAPSKLQEVTEKPSLIRTKQLLSGVENKVPADKPASNNKSLHENGPVSLNGQSLPVTNLNCSPKYNCKVDNSQTITTNSLEAMVDLDEQGVLAGKSSLDNQFGTKSVVTPKSTSQSAYTNSPNPFHVVAEQQEIVSSSQMQVGSSQNVRCETMPKPSEEPPVHINEVETDKMDASAIKMTVLPHEMARLCFANEVNKHKATLLNTPQELDAALTEKPINKEKLVETAKYSASRILSLIPAKCNQITDKVQQEKQISLNKNIYKEIYEESAPSNALAPPLTDNVSLKLNKLQPNAVNPLKGMRHLVTTLERRNVLLKYKTLFEKHGGLKKHKESFRLDNSFGKSVGAQSPMLIDESSCQSDCTIEASMPSPVVENQEIVPLSQVRNESMMNECPETSVQVNEKFVDMDASSSIKLDVLNQEVAKQCFTENEDLATAKNATLRLDDPLCNQAKSPVLADGSTRQTDYASPPKLYPVLAAPSQTQHEFDEEMPEIDCVLSDKSVRCKTDPIQELWVNVNKEEFVEMDASASIKIKVLPHKVAKKWFDGQLAQENDTAASPVCQSKEVCPLNPKTDLARAVAKHQHQTGKHDIFKNKHQTLTATTRLDEHYCNGDKSPVFTDGSDSLAGNASPPTLQPVLAEPSPVQSDEEMPEIDCVPTDKSVRCDTDPKPGQEFPVETNQEETGGLDTSVCIKINVLPHEVAMQYFADQIIEDKNIAVPPEIMQKACLLISPTDTVSTKKQTNMWRLEGTDGARSPVLTEGSASLSFCASPPKLDPVTKESTQVQNKSNEEMPEIDCMLKDESISCKTDLKTSEECPGNISEEETATIDGLVSIKINVLPHEMAQLWFAGETEDKNLQKDTSVHNSTEDQVKVQDLELKSEKEVLLEDVKSEERKHSSSGVESLDSYCCLAKWFQTLEYGNGSLCMCQIKAELKEKETKIDVQAEKDSLGEYKHVAMDDAALERTDDSETTDDSEDEIPLLHDPSTDETKIVKDISSSEEVSKAETETSEQKINESPTECATNMTPMNEIEQDAPAPDLKKTNTVCLALFGSSSEKGRQLKLTKRCKETSSCEEPPKTLQVTISSHLKVINKSESKKRKCVESEDEDAADRRKRIQRASVPNPVKRKSLPSHPVSRLSKNSLSSTSVRQLLSQSGNVKKEVHLAEGNKRKRSHKCSTQQISINKYIIRGKTVPSILLHSPENVKKSKYEIGNPALMPLDNGPGLEFKVLPETFNFEDGAELQADSSQIIQNERSGPEEKTERMETSHAPTQGVWSFSPLKKKCTEPIQDTDVSGSCSLFQEFKKKYQEKKDIDSKQNLISS